MFEASMGNCIMICYKLPTNNLIEKYFIENVDFLYLADNAYKKCQNYTTEKLKIENTVI